jgi:hypothetical protein
VELCAELAFFDSESGFARIYSCTIVKRRSVHEKLDVGRHWTKGKLNLLTVQRRAVLGRCVGDEAVDRGSYKAEVVELCLLDDTSYFITLGTNLDVLFGRLQHLLHGLQLLKLIYPVRLDFGI